MERLSEEFFYRDLEEMEKDRLHRSGTCFRFSPGDVLFWKGKTAYGLFTIISGEIDVFQDYHEKNGKLLKTLTPGMMISDRAILSDCPRNSTVVAHTSGVICRIDEDFFRSLMDKHPELMVRLLRNLVILISHTGISLKARLSYLKALQDSREKINNFVA